ncbi:MAG: PKD domain-containing protein [Desulfurococcus sp.]
MGIMSSLLGYLDWILWALSISVIIVSIIKHVLGHRDSGAWFLRGVAGLLLAGFSSILVNSLYNASQDVLGHASYGWILHASSLGLVLIGGLYIAMGRIGEGISSILGGILLIGVGLMGIYLGSSLHGGYGGPLYVYLYTDKQGYYVGEAVGLSVSISPGINGASYTVSWGDGVVEEFDGGSSLRLSHVYNSSGAYVIRVNVSSSGLTGFNSIAVSVSDKPWTPPWPFDIIVSPVTGFFSMFWQVVSTPFNLQLLTTSPRLEEGSAEWGLYELTFSISMSGLGLYLGFRLLQAVFEGESRGFIDVVREALIAVLLSLTAPYLHNASVDMLNAFSLKVVECVDPMPSIASILALISTGVALGFFIPVAANLAVVLTIMLASASALVVIRHWLILTITVSSPILAIAYLHPALRGAMNRVIGLWGSLVLAGPLTAVFMRTWSTQVGVAGQALTSVFIYMILPNIIGLLGGVGPVITRSASILLYTALGAMRTMEERRQTRTQRLQAGANTPQRIRLLNPYQSGIPSWRTRDIE